MRKIIKFVQRASSCSIITRLHDKKCTNPLTFSVGCGTIDAVVRATLIFPKGADRLSSTIESRPPIKRDERELCVNFLAGDFSVGVYTSIAKWVNRIVQLAEKDARIVLKNDPALGYIDAELPIEYFTLRKPRELSPEQRTMAAERLAAHRASTKQAG